MHGAGGGVGLAAVELGKLLGATVIAAASSEEKLAVAQARGADHLVLYGREPFRDAVKRITDGRGADVVYDPVGGEIFEQSLRCIAWGARVLVIGFTGGIGLARTNLVLIKGASVLGVRAGEAARKNPALGVARIKALGEWAEAGRITAEHLAPAAAGGLCEGDAALDGAQGDRAGGVDDEVRCARQPRIRHSGMRPLRAQARNPYSRWWLWIPGSRRAARPGMTVG